MATNVDRVDAVRRPIPAVGSRVWQGALLVSVGLCVAGASTLGDPGRLLTFDPDLARVLRFMAAVKGGMALLTLALVGLRLGEPVTPARAIGYLAAAGGVAAAPTLMWQLTWIGPAALLFYAAMTVLVLLGRRDVRR